MEITMEERKAVGEACMRPASDGNPVTSRQGRTVAALGATKCPGILEATPRDDMGR
jgi:hypothetical protein